MAIKVAILGGGPGGYVAAIRCAQLGAEVTLVEKAHLGGTCLNRGCIPSKILKISAERLEMIRRAGEFGIEGAGEAHLNLSSLLSRKERILQMERRGIEGLLKRNGITFLSGEGYLAGPGELGIRLGQGGERSLEWDRLIIATGSGTTTLLSLPFDGKDIISSDDALEMSELPGSLLIVGGGVIGCEFASIFSALGVRVTIVEALDRLLPLSSVDEACSKTLQREMKKRKIQIYTGKIVESVERVGDGLAAKLAPSPFDHPAPENTPPVTISVDKVLVCVGRSSSTGALNLEAIGLSPDPRGWIRVNDKLQTTVPNVYAIGDVLGPAKVMLAHVASMEGVVAAENCLGGSRTMDYTAVPNAIFTSPEVAGVGFTASQAHTEGIAARAETVLFRTNSKAHVMGEIAGQATIVSNEETGQILGVHMIGPHVTDLIGEGTLAVQMGCTVEQLSQTIHAHPTLPEVMLETAYKLLRKPVHG